MAYAALDDLVQEILSLRHENGEALVLRKVPTHLDKAFLGPIEPDDPLVRELTRLREKAEENEHAVLAQLIDAAIIEAEHLAESKGRSRGAGRFRGR